MPREHRVLRHRHDVVEPGLRIQEIEDLRGRKAPVEANENRARGKRRSSGSSRPSSPRVPLSATTSSTPRTTLPVSRRSMLRMAAVASSVVASTPTVFPFCVTGSGVQLPPDSAFKILRIDPSGSVRSLWCEPTAAMAPLGESAS